MTLKIMSDTIDIEPKLSETAENEFLLEIESDNIQFSFQLSKLQIQTLGLKCIQSIPEPDINPRFNNIGEEDVYRIPLQGLVHLEDREIQTILREGDMSALEIFLWYMQSNEELINRFLNNMSKRAGDMMRDGLKSFPDAHPDTAPIRRLKQAREATEKLMKVISRLQSCGEIGPF